jgi:flagellar biosynthesis/type III secretory pathway ATPase
MKKEGNLENSQSEIQKLKKRVEELEDLNFQLNLNRQEEEKIEYQTAIQQLVFECGVKNEIIEKQKMKLKVYFQNENVNVIDESEMINELIKVMREKDELIVNLQKEVKGKVVNNIINFDERFNSTRLNYDENEEKYNEKKKEKGMERSVVSYNPNDFIYISSK